MSSYKLILAAALCATAAAAGPFDDCLPGAVEHGVVTLQCGKAVVRLEAVTPEMLRVRTSEDGTFPESLTERWGFVRSKWPAAAVTVKRTPGAVTLETAALRVKVGLKPLRLTVLDKAGRTVYQDDGSTATAVSVSMAASEHFYGLGFQRTALDVRGRKLQWWRAFRSNEATVPFFMSSRGYGFYSNNTYRHVFDFTGSDRYTVTADGGRQDYYVILGPSYKAILDRYTALTGKPMLAPRWAMGIGYECRYLDEQHQVLNVAKGFRREDIPIDWIGLEPGWEDIPYNMKWKWNYKRFPDPDGMIREMAGMGIKMGLWESGAAPKTGYTDEAVRKEWYRPRIDGAIRRGIKFFKQDDPYPRMISSQEMLDPEFNPGLGGSGKFSAAEMNNTTNTLYSDTAMKEYTRATGERAMIMFNGYNSSIASHRWPFTWEADFPLGVGALCASLSGHSLVSTRDRNEAPDGIHLGYLAPFSYLEAWAYYKEPWLYSEPLLEMNRRYVKLRYQLLPYLYSSHRQSVVSGVPVMRPMLLEYQQDPATANLASEFLLGDWLLVGSATARMTSGSELPTGMKREDAGAGKPKIYLPKGRWYDFWTGSAVESKGEWKDVSWPKTVGGPLWVKGGAIIPMGQVVSYAEQEPLDVVRLDVYPSGTSKYTVYEDDGRTYAYEKGAFSTTEVTSTERAGGLRIAIGERKGSYPEMPKRRGYLVSVHTALAPVTVTVAGEALKEVPSTEDLLYVAGRKGWHYDAEAGTLWIKPAAGWRYDYDSRGAGKDADRDTVYWSADVKAEARAVAIDIGLKPAVKAKPVFGRAVMLGVTAADRVLIADGTSTTKVKLTVLDAARRRVMDARVMVDVAVDGPASLDQTKVEAVDGLAVVTLRSTKATGTVKLKATAAGLTWGDDTVKVVKGQLRLQASPPERVKLNSDGGWLPLRVTLYATIQYDGVTVKSASTRLHLHMTGGSGKVPADRDVEAVEGIGVFPDVVFEKPPKYVMQVSGDGVETARIPIY